MAYVNRKHRAIDILKLYSNSGTKEWNKILSFCLREMDVRPLEFLIYGIQVGMDDLAKKNMVTNEISIWFARIMGSLKRTVEQIMRAKTPLISDINGWKKTSILTPLQIERERKKRQQRRQELQSFFKKVSF